MQEIQEGIEHIIKNREKFSKTSAVDFWHLKTCLRFRVKQLAVRNHDIRLQGIQALAKALLLSWNQRVKDRNNRLLKLESLDLARQRKGMIYVLRTWIGKVGHFKILQRKGLLLESSQQKKLVRSTFIALEFNSYSMRRRRAVFERNATRFEYQASRMHFEVWVEFRDRSKRNSNRLQLFIKIRATKFRVRAVFSLWVEKHNRTSGFDRCLFFMFLATKRTAFLDWHFVLQSSKNKLTYVDSAKGRVRRSCLVDCIECWREITHRSRRLSSKIEKVSTRHLNNIVSQVLHLWCLRRNETLRTQMVISKIDCLISALKFDSFQEWKLLCLKCKRVASRLEAIRDNSLLRFLDHCFDVWIVVTKHYRIVKGTCTKISNRQRQFSLLRCLGLWVHLLEHTNECKQKLRKLQEKINTTFLQVGFSYFLSFFQSSLIQSKEMDRLQQQHFRYILLKTMQIWHRDLVIFESKVKKFTFRASHKLCREIKIKALHSWSLEIRRKARLIQKIQIWEIKDVKKTFESWSTTILCDLIRRDKVARLTAVRQTKLSTLAFFVWNDYSKYAKKRRWSIQFFCDKSVTKFCTVSFRAFAMIAILERRRRVIVANLQRWIGKQKVLQATQYLLSKTRQAKISRHQLERGYSRYLFRMVKACWKVWASKIDAKKQTTAVLAKAGAVLIDMM